MRILQNMLTALVSAPNRMRALGWGQPANLAKDPQSAVEAVLSATGQVSSLVYAGTLLDQIEAMDDEALQHLLTHIAVNHDVDASALADAAALYARKADAPGLTRLTKLAEPRWMELFRRLNATDGGTVRLVRLRQRILKLTSTLPDAARIDSGLQSLLRMWFNPGFLILQPIDWSTPANILEKIIAYEAVHEISSWEDLRARLAPEDRRCFAFFHPSMPEEPLIFVEVALTDETPGQIAPILRIDRETISGDSASTAVFYSISNCQSGLAGISFGNFLIKRVAQELKQEFPELKRFVTLSPVPGLMRWLRVREPELASTFLAGDDAFWNEEAVDSEREFKAAALRYFLESDREDRLPNDPVARFHLGNGASLEQLNFAADLSEKGISQAGGLMVNYLYDLAVVEANHEAFHETKQVPMSAALRQLQRSLKS
ncbi:MAG: malonyl-CoA decarboxylase family protein [Pseudomonadota bacterium]|nr:malonyl-CoA decarboxylase family protein [Pseudomonadota bacterium]MEC8549346.1 malonyl-CoA decarboxylase family protein [Pseudomonadota bacterium]